MSQFRANAPHKKSSYLTLEAFVDLTIKPYDKVWMYEEMMTNDDNVESNLLT